MRINNRTPIPNSLIGLVTQVAADFVHAETEGLTVHVNPGQRFHGTASFPGDKITLTLPITQKGVKWHPAGEKNPRAFGLRLYALLVHEAQHAVDFQNKLPFMCDNDWHSKRECEGRAIAAAQIAYDLVRDDTPPWLEKIITWVEQFM